MFVSIIVTCGTGSVSLCCEGFLPQSTVTLILFHFYHLLQVYIIICKAHRYDNENRLYYQNTNPQCHGLTLELIDISFGLRQPWHPQYLPHTTQRRYLFSSNFLPSSAVQCVHRKAQAIQPVDIFFKHQVYQTHKFLGPLTTWNSFQISRFFMHTKFELSLHSNCQIFFTHGFWLPINSYIWVLYKFTHLGSPQIHPFGLFGNSQFGPLYQLKLVGFFFPLKIVEISLLLNWLA